MSRHSTLPQPSSGDFQAAAREVGRLLAEGKCKQAVELAKDGHKRWKTADSERLVVDAYLRRIEQFQKKGSVEDAQTLLNLVYERYPAHRARLSALRMQSAAATANVSALVAPLARADVAAETREAVETAIRQQLVDLEGLAKCTALPAEHPLRVAAGAVWQAMEAVTSGPVSEAQIALPEVSRKSPLAAWKLLVRAIAAFHANDDEGCRRVLAAIPADAAAHRLAGTMLTMMEHRPAGSGASGALAAQVVRSDKPLRDAVRQVEGFLGGYNLGRLIRAIGNAVQACDMTAPELVDTLKQRISIRATIMGVPQKALRGVLEPMRKGADYWRQQARGGEVEGSMVWAAYCWDRFVTRAVQEGLVKSGGVEQATVYLHMARLLVGWSEQELLEARRDVIEQLGLGFDEDATEVIEIKAAQDVVRRATDVHWLFGRSGEMHADVETFREWWAWAADTARTKVYQEDAAKAWHRALPNDPQPLVLLSELAEERDALTYALKYVSEAEAIDAMNPHVRKARLRLMLGMTWRHFKERKAHLVDKDIAALEALPAMAEGDRAAFLVALRLARHALVKDNAAAIQAWEEVKQRLGHLTGLVVANSALEMAGLYKVAGAVEIPGVALPDPLEVAQAQARAMLLAEDLALRITMLKAWDEHVEEVLRRKPCPLSVHQLLALGRLAGRRQDMRMSYLVSSAGLESASGPAAARFLVMRAQGLPAWADGRKSQCLRAAMTLAQQTNDPQLMGEVAAAIERHGPTRRMLGRPGGGGLKGEVLKDVLAAEREARAWPRSVGEAERAVVTIQSDAPAMQRQPFFMDDEDDDDEYEEDEYGGEGAIIDEEEDYEDEDDGPRMNMPAEVLPILDKILKKFGRLPNPQELTREEPRLAEELTIALMAAKAGLPPRAVQAMFDATSDEALERVYPTSRKKKRRR